MTSQKSDSSQEQAPTLHDAALEQVQGGTSVLIINKAIRDAIAKPPPRTSLLPRWYWDIIA